MIDVRPDIPLDAVQPQAVVAPLVLDDDFTDAAEQILAGYPRRGAEIGFAAALDHTRGSRWLGSPIYE